MIFSQTKDYSEMLNKIGFCTFSISVALTVIIGNVSPMASNFLKSINIPVKFWLFEEGIPILYVVLPFLIVFLITRPIRLHDKVSNLFGIRKSFDINNIIIPLAKGSKVVIDGISLKQLEDKRQSLMRRVFYKYAGSYEPKIDKQLVIQALDSWFCLWILIEAITVGVVAVIIMFVLGLIKVALITSLVALFSTIFVIPILKSCSRIAQSEVEDILSDPERRAEIKHTFNEIFN